jgi:release factor glutamine methyltransferase
MFAPMTSREIYTKFLRELQQIYSSGEAAVITTWVFQKIAGLQRSDIIKNPGLEPGVQVTDQLHQSLEALLLHKPVQYVLGEAWFCNMKLLVNEEVLIPRPETEELVEWVIDEWHPTAAAVELTGREKSNPKILDIGTGSGCIAIALKKMLPVAELTAIDFSAGALTVAGINAAAQEADVTLMLIDFLTVDTWASLGCFDVIVSNPPYIPLNEKERLDKNVTLYEPHSALFVPDKSPLLFYEKIALFGLSHLWPGGKIYVEIHEDFAEATSGLFSKYYVVEVRQDILGKKRMLAARRLD